MALRAEHALIRGLRTGGSETELTRALAAVLAEDARMAAAFVRVVLQAAPRAGSLDLEDLPEALLTRTEEARLTSTEEREGDSRLDLSFADERRRWHVIVELKIHAGYGANQVLRYLDAFYPEAERTLLVAVTRNVPSGRESDDPRWAGAVRWGDMLEGLRALRPENRSLAEQWRLFLDVLEAEGSMGFTKADTDLLQAWARFPPARAHAIDFVDAVRRPLLDELRLALAQAHGKAEPDERDAAFFARGRTGSRIVIPQLGKVTVRFRVPADGDVRVWAGLWGWGDPRFIVETSHPRTAGEDASRAVAFLFERGFESWRDRNLTRYLRLDAEALARHSLQQEVIAFARGAFDAIAASGLLAVEAAVPADEEPDA